MDIKSILSGQKVVYVNKMYVIKSLSGKHTFSKKWLRWTKYIL